MLLRSTFFAMRDNDVWRMFYLGPSTRGTDPDHDQKIVFEVLVSRGGGGGGGPRRTSQGRFFGQNQ